MATKNRTHQVTDWRSVDALNQLYNEGWRFVNATPIASVSTQGVLYTLRKEIEDASPPTFPLRLSFDGLALAQAEDWRDFNSLLRHTRAHNACVVRAPNGEVLATALRGSDAWMVTMTLDGESYPILFDKDHNEPDA